MYIIIVGASKAGINLAKTLLSGGHEVTLIDQDKLKVSSLSEAFGDVIMLGNGANASVLKVAGANRADVIAALTGDDATNLVICQLTKLMFKAPRTISRVSDPANEEIFQSIGVDATINSTRMLNYLIEEQVKAGDVVVPLFQLKGGNVELVQVEVQRQSNVMDRKIKDLGLPAGVIIVSIYRGDETIIPKGETVFRQDDEVIAIVKKEHIDKIQQMFRTSAGQ
ncbi:MAG: NAD-binding protein [Deltaproteobacteria bacterium]|nr:NAD-binding protein [Deltaproteobacteria bacterium]MCL5277308.1 NAD-binding protein [Deltaproteobacteria bacterium]